METDEIIKNDSTRCEDFLSAEELVAIRKPTEESTAHVIGSKFYRQTHSHIEEKAVEASMANFSDTLNKKRATRICDLMQAKWDDQLNASLTDKLKGKYVQHMGRSVDGKVALSPEESMFLLENGCIEIMNGNTPMSTQEGFSVMLKRSLGVEKYKVYSHLAQLGFIVVSHQKELGITRYEKNMNLDKHHIKKRKATTMDIEEPNKKRLTFTGALLEEIKQINQQKDWDITLEDDDSVTECSSRAETSNVIRNSQPSERVKEAENENLNVDSMDIQVKENVEENIWVCKERENVDSNSVCSIRDEVSTSVGAKNLTSGSCNDIQMDHQPAQEHEIECVVKGPSRSDNSLSCSKIFPAEKLSSTSEHSFSDRLPSTSECPCVNDLPSANESTPLKELPSTTEATCIRELHASNELPPISGEVPSTIDLTRINEMSSIGLSTPNNELPSTSVSTPNNELPSTWESTPNNELPSTCESTSNDELPSTSKLPSNNKSSLINELHSNSKVPIDELPSTNELITKEFPTISKSPVNELPSSSQSVSVNLLTSPSESSPNNELLTPKEVSSTSDFTPEEMSSTSELTPKELPSTNASPPVDELASTNEPSSINDPHPRELIPKELTSTNASPPIDELASTNKPSPNNDPHSSELQLIDKCASNNEQPSTRELQLIDNLDSTCKQPSTNELPSITEILPSGKCPHVNELTFTTELHSASGRQSIVDLSSHNQLLSNGETPTSRLQVTLESESVKQQHVVETQRNSMSASEKSDIEVMDVDSQSNEVSDSSRDVLDKETHTFGNSINFLASGNSVVDTIESNENTDLDVLSCSSPKSVESDVLSLEPDSEDSYPRNDYEDPENDYEEEDITLLEVTKKETKPLAVIDLLSEEEDKSSGSDSSESDDEISVVEVRSAPSGSKDTHSGSVNPKKVCKKEEGSSSVPTNSNTVAASPPKVIFPVLGRKNIVCVARPPLNLVPINVKPAKEAYILEIKPRVDEQQPRLWSSYRQMHAYQQMLRQRRQNPDFSSSTRTLDESLQQHPRNRTLQDSPVPNLNNFDPPMDVNRNPVSYPPMYPVPHTSQINSVVSIRQQNMSMVENHNFPPFPPDFPANVALPNLRPGMAPAQILDQVQRTAFSVATNMISYMMNQQQPQRSDLPRFPPPMNSYNSYSNVNGHGSDMHPNAVPPFFSNGVPPDFLNERRRFRRRRHTGRPFPCSFKGASNKRNWDEVKASINISTEDPVPVGTLDIFRPASDGSDIEEVPITPTETLWDSPVNPKVKPGVRLDKSLVLSTLQKTEAANLRKSHLNDRCFQESTSLEVSFDVYLPGFNYKKTSPGIPKHRIIVVRASDPVPRYSELAFIHRKWNDGAFLQVAIVDNGDVSFVSFNGISLPSMIPSES